MYNFICKAVKGKITPLQPSKFDLLEKLLNSYEELGKNFMVTIQIIEKDINSQQIGLYRAFIIKAADHFGNTYIEMEVILKRFHPYYESIGTMGGGSIKPIEKWNSRELDDFISKASAFLGEHGFVFK